MRSLLVAAVLVAFAPGARAQVMVDPGPFWAGVTDTTTLQDQVDLHTAAAHSLLAEIRAVEGERSATNTLAPLLAAEREIGEAQALVNTGKNLHPSPSFRAFAGRLGDEVGERFAGLDTDPALYAALIGLDRDRLEPVERYVVEQKLRGFRRRGVGLAPAAQARAAAIREAIRGVGERFARNTFPQPETVRIHPDSLGGLPPDWVASSTGPAGDDGLVELALSPATFQMVLTASENAALRERTMRWYLSQGHPENLPLIDSLRTLRHDLATLLGFDSWAHYTLSTSMAGSPERVARFLDHVDDASRASARRFNERLLALRRQHEPEATTVPIADVMYWTMRLSQAELGFDPGAMRTYFPYAGVRDGMLGAYEAMFGLEFRPAPEMPVWSDAAEPYEVYEAGSLVGRFVLDLHPRDGKFGHCAQFTLRGGGGRVPEAAVACNLPGGAEGDPGLLMPDQVASLFHEFGHVVHALVAGRAALAGAAESDFREAPSMLFEAWAMDPGVLRRIARHYETGEPIPDGLAAAYRRSDALFRAEAARSQLQIAELDLLLFSSPPAADPTAAIERRVLERSILPFPDYYHPAANVPHLYHYGTNYYTYLWSQVIARDLLTGFDEGDLLSAEAGARYRRQLLAPTGTAPSATLVEAFLGRPFDADAWRAWLREADDE